MDVGAKVKVIGGTHKGKKGKIEGRQPRNGHQKGKTPVLVGCNNEIYWVKPEYLQLDAPEQKNTPKNIEQKILDFIDKNPTTTDIAIAGELGLSLFFVTNFLKSQKELTLTELPSKESCQIFKYLHDRKEICSDLQIGQALDLPLNQVQKAILVLKERKLIEEIEPRRYICEQLGFSRELADFAEGPNSSGDSTGLNQSRSTLTQSESCDRSSITEFFMGTSETITPHQEAQTSTPLGSPAREPVTQGTEQGLHTQNQTSGLSLSGASAKDDPRLSLLRTLKDLSLEDYEQCLGDSEWQATSGRIRTSYQQRKLERLRKEPDCLLSPTMTASSGKISRPAGTTRCEEWFRKQGIIRNFQVLSVPAMASISGFPIRWTECLGESSLTVTRPDLKVDSCLEEPSSPNKPQSLCSELSNFGEQWLDPGKVITSQGTQSREVGIEFNVDVSTVQEYAEKMCDRIWDWHQKPLPVAFRDDSGEIYAADCHHRVSAARKAGVEIFVDLRQGSLIDAKLYSCTANTNHGLQIRPKDQRKRITMFLDILDSLTDEERSRLLESANFTDTEQRSGWSSRNVAKYLKMAESGYRTVINVLIERDAAGKFSQFSVGDCVKIANADFNMPGMLKNFAHAIGELATVESFDRRKGVFITPRAKHLSPAFIHPGCLSLDVKMSDFKQIENESLAVDNTSKPIFTSVGSELAHKAKELGVPLSGLPEIKRNEGDPESLDDFPSIKQGITLVKDICDEIIEKLPHLSDKQVEKIWLAIAPRFERIRSANG